MHFQQFVWTFKKLTPNRHFCWHLLRTKSGQKCRFGGHFFESWKQLLKRHVLGQNELTNKSRRNWHQKCPQMTLTAKNRKKVDFYPFLKSLLFAPKRHVLGQNELNNRFRTTRKSESAQKRLFWPHACDRQFWSIFRKMPKSPFWEARIFFDLQPIALKFRWALKLALKSSHIKFQRNQL